jgi:hypothetical protein
MKTIKIQITLLEEMLGTSSMNPEIHEEFIASKSADAEKIKEELETLPTEELIEKSKTVFPRQNDKPFLWDYQLKGFFKDACSMLARVSKSKSKELRAYKKIIDGLVFVQPRKILFELPHGSQIGDCQRPLRGQTAQGERIALANSETVPEGTNFVCEIVLLEDSLEKHLLEWLDYGKLRGLGQWRNSGKGKFTYKVL